MEDSDARNLRVGSGLSSRAAYLNLYPLLELDTEATLDVLRFAFVEDDIPRPELSSHNSADARMDMRKENIRMESQNLLVQHTVDALIRILDKDNSQADRSSVDDKGSMEEWSSMKEIGNLFEFIAHNVSCGRSKISKRVICQIF